MPGNTVVMRCWITLLFFLFIIGTVAGQADRKNRKPKIVGQNVIGTNEETPVTIQLTDLKVEDKDDWFYPWGFTLRVYEGANYTFSGATINPVFNFSGILNVPVTVNDGLDDSEKYNLQITVRTVNDAPVITGQAVPLTIDQNKSILIELNHLNVVDSDNSYPSGFTLTVLPSNNNSYTVSGNQVTPPPGYSGTMTVTVKVNDGQLDSQSYALQIKVNPGNTPPVITGQVPMTVNEDESIVVQFSHLTVKDPDNSYPTGFSLILPTSNLYSITGNIVTPAKDFTGTLQVSVAVSDGFTQSNIYSLTILVKPINDPPVISQLETEMLSYQIGKGPEVITQLFDVTDVDNDSLMQAEVGFLPEHYRVGNDELIFTNTTSIKGNFDIARGLLVLSGKALLKDYVAAIRTIKYNYITVNEPIKESKTVFFKVTDGKAVSEIKEREINATDVIVKLDIPSAFTPNGDSANDTWSITPLKQTDGISDVVVRIYNRHGKLLFETVGFKNEWDGRLNGELLPADTYYFTIDFNKAYSKNSMKGIVALLR